MTTTSTTKVMEAFRLKRQSENLIKMITRTLEIAIEQDEESACLWLNKQRGCEFKDIRYNYSNQELSLKVAENTFEMKQKD